MPLSSENWAQSALWNITVVQRETANPDNEWVNTFTVSSNNAVVDGAAATAWAGALVAPFRSVMSNRCTLDRIRISTYQRGDTDPYDANEFVVVPVGLAGLRVTISEPYPPSIAVSVRRRVAAGRSGFFLLRGVVAPQDVTEALSGMVLTPAARTFLQDWANALRATLSTLGEGVAYVVPSVNKFQADLVLPNAREVLSHQVLGVSVTRHRRGRR